MTEETAGRKKQRLRAAASGIIVRALAAVRAATLRSNGRRQAEEALRDSEERYRDLAENLHDSIFEIDTSGRITYISPAVQELGGYSPSEIVGRPFPEFLHPNDLGPAMESFRKGLSGNVQPVECRILSKSGEIHHMQSLPRPVFEEDRLVGFRGALIDITERKRAEEALRESVQMFQSLIDHAPFSIWICNGDGTIIRANPATLEMFGVTDPSDIIGRFNVYRDITDAEKPLLSHFERAWAGEVARFTEDLDMTTVKYGTTRRKTLRFHSTLFAIPARGDARPNLVVMQEDITERKQAEEALRRSEEYLAKAQEVARIGSWTWDLATNTVKWSDEMYRLFDMSPDEFDGKIVSVMDRIHPDDRDLLAQVTNQTLIDGKPRPLEYRVVRRDGTSIVVYAEGVTHLDESGKAVRMLGTVQDVTERKRAEEALRESLGLLQTVIEGATDPIFVKDADGRYVMVNSEALRLVGVSAAEIVGKDDTAVFPPDEARQLMEDDRKVMESGVPRTLEDVVTVAGVERTYLSRKRVWRDPDGKVIGLIGVATDITERKRMEEALQAAREELEAKVERQMLRRNPYGLTFRELTVLHLVVAGRSGKEIGVELGISPLTAHKHISNILTKMEASSRTEAGVRAVREGLLD